MKRVGIISTAVLSVLLGVTVPAFAQHEQQGEKQDHSKQQPAKHEQAKPEAQHAKAQHQSAEKSQPAEHAHHQPSPESKHSQHAQQQRPAKQEQTRISPEHAQKQHSTTHEQHAAQHAQKEQRTEPHKQQAHAQPDQKSERGRHPSERAQTRDESGRRTPEQQRVQHAAWHEHGSHNWDADHRNWQQRGGYHGYRIPDDRFRGYFGQDHGFRISGLPFLVVGGFPRFQYQGYWFSEVDPWPEYWGDNWYDNDDVYVNYVDNGYYLYNRRYPNVGIAINVSM